jgi:hypothetical protein
MSKADFIEPAPLSTFPRGYDVEGADPKARPVAHGDVVTEGEERDLRRGLQQRHVSMLALAGELYPVKSADERRNWYWLVLISRRGDHYGRSTRSVIRVRLYRSHCMCGSIRSRGSHSASPSHWVVRPTRRIPLGSCPRIRFGVEYSLWKLVIREFISLTKLINRYPLKSLLSWSLFNTGRTSTPPSSS